MTEINYANSRYTLLSVTKTGTTELGSFSTLGRLQDYWKGNPENLRSWPGHIFEEDEVVILAFRSQ